MKAKAVVRDVGRALDMSFKETDRIAKLIPDDLKMTIKKALDAEPELATLYKEDQIIRKLIDISMRLEGLSRHASTHAAGVVVSDKPMDEYLPIYRGEKRRTCHPVRYENGRKSGAREVRLPWSADHDPDRQHPESH